MLKRTKSAELHVAPPPVPARPPWGYDELQFAQALDLVRHQAMVLDVQRRLAAAAHGEQLERPDALGLRAAELEERERGLDQLQARHARARAWAETAIGTRMAEIAASRGRIDEAERELEQRRAALGELGERLARETDELGVVRKELAGRRQQLERDRSELEERLVAVRTREAELERALAAVRAEEALLRARREELSAQELSQERELSALHEELVRAHTLYDRGKVDVVERLAAVQARESELVDFQRLDMRDLAGMTAAREAMAGWYRPYASEELAAALSDATLAPATRGRRPRHSRAVWVPDRA